MTFLGMSLIETSSLSLGFQEIAKAWGDGDLPELIWAVFHKGGVVAIYPSPDAAYMRLKLVKHGLDIDQLPVKQTMAEVEIGSEEAFDEFASPPRYQPEIP